MEGLCTDEIYEKFIRQIAGGSLNANDAGDSIKEAIERDEKRASLQKQIDRLQAKICKEKQLNAQMQMNSELKKIKKDLEDLA